MKCGSVCSGVEVGDAVLGVAENILLDLTSGSGAQLEVSSEGVRQYRYQTKTCY